MTECIDDISPKIEPAIYGRRRGEGGDRLEGGAVEYTYHGLDRDAARKHERCIVEDGWVIYRGQLGDVYLHGGHAHVHDTTYRAMRIALLREYVLESLAELRNEGVVRRLEEVANSDRNK